MPGNPRRRLPRLPPLRKIPSGHIFQQGNKEPHLQHRLLGPGESPRYRGEVLPLSQVQRRNLENLGIKISNTSVILWPGSVERQERAAQEGRKRPPVVKTIGFDRGERHAAHQVEGSEQTRNRALTVGPILAGIHQYLIEQDRIEPAQRQKVVTDLQVLGLMLGKSSRGHMKAARHAMRDAGRFLLQGNTTVTVMKLWLAHNELAARLNESSGILPRVERRHTGIVEKNAELRSEFRKWLRGIDEDARAIQSFRMAPQNMTMIANKYLHHARRYGQIATAQSRKGIIHEENRRLSQTLGELSTAIRDYRDSGKNSKMMGRILGLFSSARHWGHVRNARSFAVRSELFREATTWKPDERAALLRAQYRWAADNIDHWAKGDNTERITPWIESLGVAMKADGRFNDFLPSLRESYRLAKQGKFDQAVSPLEHMLPNMGY